MRIYFMSICGTGMGNAALLLRSLGHEVLGADQNVYPPMSDTLRRAGIEILEGYDAERLAALKPDLVVVGNVNTRGNPEVEWLLETRAIAFTSLPEALNRFVLAPRKNIVVAGTHGKTTTSCLAAFLLRENGRDPGYLIGGVPQDLPSGSYAGDAAAPFVIEGDEYDSAFFDKRSKFIHYAPNILALNNLEFDHADIFRDLGDIQRTFSHLMRIVPRNGFVLANGDDPNLAALLNIGWTTVIRVGTSETCDLRILEFNEDADGASFTLSWKRQQSKEVQWQVWGLYNARNAAMAALAAGLALNPSDPLAIDLSSLSRFKGVQRRQQVLLETDSITVLTDFAHHPTAIAETLRSLRHRYPGRILHACFEARSNTACRRVLQDAFTRALSEADRIHLGTIFRAERYADEERINFPDMALDLGPRASVHGDNLQLRKAVLEELEDARDRVVVFFTNGSFDGQIPLFLEGLQARAQR